MLLCYLWHLLLSKATIMQTLVYLLNFSVTNYSIMPNGVIYKGLFLARKARFPRLHGESLQRLLGR